MLSEILLYEINVSKKESESLFAKKESIKYLLTYRIDEDRFWYYKIENKKEVDSHLMKQNIDNSIKTMQQIYTRYTNFNDIYTNNNVEVKYTDYLINNEKLASYISSLSDSKEEMYTKKKSNNNSSYSGIFLTDID